MDLIQNTSVLPKVSCSSSSSLNPSNDFPTHLSSHTFQEISLQPLPTEKPGETVRLQVLCRSKYGSPFVPVNPLSLQKIYKTVVVAVMLSRPHSVKLVIQNCNPRFNTYAQECNIQDIMYEFTLNTIINKEETKKTQKSTLSLYLDDEVLYSIDFKQITPTTTSRYTPIDDLASELIFVRNFSTWICLVGPITGVISIKDQLRQQLKSKAKEEENLSKDSRKKRSRRVKCKSERGKK